MLVPVSFMNLATSARCAELMLARGGATTKLLRILLRFALRTIVSRDQSSSLGGTSAWTHKKTWSTMSKRSVPALVKGLTYKRQKRPQIQPPIYRPICTQHTMPQCGSLPLGNGDQPREPPHSAPCSAPYPAACRPLVRDLQHGRLMRVYQVRASAFLSLCVALTGCGGSEGDAPEPDAGSVGAPFSTAPGEPNHEEITATALSFLRPDILSGLQAADVATDVEFVLVNANHFDDCNFVGGSLVVSSSQAEAVAQLNPSAQPLETDPLAIVAFARSLHALQDFYAHTNWIELGGQALVDSSLVSFATLSPYSTIPSSGFVVVQGPKPKHAALARDDAAAYPRSALVTVKLGKKRAPGLVSGTVDYEAGNFCPAPVAMSHADLNKDKSTIAGRSEQYEAAKALAILQTEHEWCRLRALTQAKWGDAGLTRLDAWIAAGATPPACL